MSWLHRWICAFRGHTALLHFGRSRMSLICTSCGYESPGWNLKDDWRPPARVIPITRQRPSAAVTRIA